MSESKAEPTPLPIPDRPLLRGERVWLRPLEERDLTAYVAGINDTEVGGLAGYAAPMSLEQAKGWIAEHLKKSSKRRAIAQYLQLLAAGAKITGVELAAADSPLVQ